MNPPPAPSAVTLRIEKVVAEGDGFAHLDDGKVVFVEGALPDELVDVRITKSSKDFARGIVVGIRETNADRVDPPCRYVARGCGGCDLQHASTDLQSRIKTSIVRESLVRLGRIDDPDVRPGVRDIPAEGARTTIRLATAPSGRLGFRQRKSHDVVRIDECLVAHPALNHLVSRVRLVGSAEMMMRVSTATGEIGVWVEPAVDVEGLPDGVSIGRTGSIRERVAGHELKVSNGSFFQSSPEAAEALVDAVRRAASDVLDVDGPVTSPARPVVDAYGGCGLFAVTAVPDRFDVVVVEANTVACADARENLGARSASVVEASVEEWDPVEASLVIADPARDGLRAAGVDVLARTLAPVIVLVSCDPASLGRDARLLEDAGYRFEFAEVLDPFPHTHHVEVVSRFVRRSS